MTTIQRKLEWEKNQKKYADLIQQFTGDINQYKGDDENGYI